jgi:hypothetical protein
LKRDFKSRRENNSLLVCLAFLFSVLPSSGRAAPPLLSEYMDCARALGSAMHERFTVVPGNRGGDKGLFLYTDQSAFFLPLGQPHGEDDVAFDFLLRTSVSNVGDIFLFFREKKAGGRTNNPSEIGYDTMAPPERVRASYRPTPALASPGEYALEVLSRAIREKVMRVKYFIDGKNHYSTPHEARLAFEQDRANFLGKLARCRLEGDRDLSLAVAEEVQKLETGTPTVTVWEKQIGGKTAAARLR